MILSCNLSFYLLKINTELYLTHNSHLKRVILKNNLFLRKKTLQLIIMNTFYATRYFFKRLVTALFVALILAISLSITSVQALSNNSPHYTNLSVASTHQDCCVSPCISLCNHLCIIFLSPSFISITINSQAYTPISHIITWQSITIPPEIKPPNYS